MRRKAGFDPAARLKRAMDAVQAGVAKGYVYTLNDLSSMDELIYRTSTVAYDTCLADRPQMQDDVKQELADPTPRKYRLRPRDRQRPGMRLTPGPGVKDEEEPDFAGSGEDEPGLDGSSHDMTTRISLLLRHRLRLLPRRLSRGVPQGHRPGGAAPVPPPPPVPIAADVTTARPI